jgi:hypothetical protein
MTILFTRQLFNVIGVSYNMGSYVYNIIASMFHHHVY